jgi:NADH-quinone oxidoreductase subunit M
MNAFPLMLMLFAAIACVGGMVAPSPRRFSLLMALLNLTLVVLMFAQYDAAAGGYQFVSSWRVLDLPHFFPIHLAFGIDGVSLPLVLLTSIVALAAVGATPVQVRREREFFVCLNLIVLGAYGAFLSLDLFFLYVFHEVALIPTFLMIGIWGGHDRKAAANQMTIYLAAGSLVLLAGLLAFFFALPEGIRSFDLRSLGDTVNAGTIARGDQGWIYLLLLVGFGALVSLWPLHSWAPRGYAAAPAPAAMLHAGVLKKFGLYGLLRLAVPYLPEGVQSMSTLLLVLLMANILYIGWVTIAQKDLTLMLGYSSVMHMGFLFLGLLSLNLTGLTGVVLLMVAHGLSAALLFGTAAEIRERAGSTLFKDLGGFSARVPVLAFLFIVGGLASIGVPGLGNFAGEVLIFFGAWKHYTPWVMVALWGLVISAVYMLRAIRATCYGAAQEPAAAWLDLPASGRVWPYALLAGALAIAGIFPGLLAGVAKPTLEALLK